MADRLLRSLGSFVNKNKLLSENILTGCVQRFDLPDLL